MSARLIAICSLCLPLIGCGAGTTTDSSTGGSGAGGGDDGAGGEADDGFGASSEGGNFAAGGGGEGGAADAVAEVYGHSAVTLYRLDPETKAVTTVGDFSGCSSVIDIALDKDSNLFGATSGGLYGIDKATAACTEIASGSFPNSLSFIPAGTLDASVEALVGYQGDQYVRIDPASGNVSVIGLLNGSGLVSSGDIVSVKGGSTYLTVKGFACPTDCLIEVNPMTGAMVKNWGELGYTSAFGIAFWAGSVYGFTDGGELFEVTFVNDVMATAFINAPPSVSFWGAGSTTSAPPIPIPR